MGIDFDKLRKEKKEISSGSGDVRYLKHKELGEAGEETIFRLLPIPDENQGTPYFKEVGYWINRKFYTSPETFGDPCPIQAEIDECDDPAALKLLKSQNYSKSEIHHYVGLELDPVFRKGKIADFKVIDDKPTILQTSALSLSDSIIDVFLDRQFQIDEDADPDGQGIAHPTEGFALKLHRVPKASFPEYHANGIAEPLEVPTKFLQNVPNVHDNLKTRVKSAEYLTQVIRNYLFDEEITVEEGHFYDTGDNEGEYTRPAKKAPVSKSEKPAAKPKQEKPAAKSKPAPPVDDEGPEDTDGPDGFDDLGDLPGLDDIENW